MKKPGEYPLVWPAGWPRMKSHKRGKFMNGRSSISYSAAEKRLLGELGRLHPGKIEVICSSNMIRDRQPADAGVAVYFQAVGKPMRVIAVDIYDRVEDNVAAIAATVEAMRAIERHGGAQILERAFTGFDALPAPASSRPWEILGVGQDASEEAISGAYRHASKKLHPDNADTGDAEKFKALAAARDAMLAARKLT